jgi:ankyrin repeat protein
MIFKIVVAASIVIAGLLLLQTGPREWNSPHSKRLLEAVRTNNLMSAATLLESGADPNVRAADGTTPLTIAIESGTASLLKLLIDRGADVNLATLDGVAPLALATKLNKPQLAALLVEAGARADTPASQVVSQAAP